MLLQLSSLSILPTYKFCAGQKIVLLINITCNGPKACYLPTIVVIKHKNVHCSKYSIFLDFRKKLLAMVLKRGSAKIPRAIYIVILVIHCDFPLMYITQQIVQQPNGFKFWYCPLYFSIGGGRFTRGQEGIRGQTLIAQHNFHCLCPSPPKCFTHLMYDPYSVYLFKKKLWRLWMLSTFQVN